MATHSIEFGRELLGIWNIPYESVQKITIQIVAGDIVQITIDRLMTDKQGKKLKHILEKYALHKINEMNGNT